MLVAISLFHRYFTGVENSIPYHVIVLVFDLIAKKDTKTAIRTDQVKVLGFILLWLQLPAVKELEG